MADTSSQDLNANNFATTPKLFGKWSYDDIKIVDKTLEIYFAIQTTKSKVFVPHTAGRYQLKRFKKAACPLVERIMGSIAFKGRNTGKKVKALRIMKQTLDIIHHNTGLNPLQVVVDAISNCGPREDSTRIGSGGTVKRQAVDVSSFRRVNVGIYLLCRGVNSKS